MKKIIFVLGMLLLCSNAFGQQWTNNGKISDIKLLYTWGPNVCSATTTYDVTLPQVNMDCDSIMYIVSMTSGTCTSAGASYYADPYTSGTVTLSDSTYFQIKVCPLTPDGQYNHLLTFNSVGATTWDTVAEKLSTSTTIRDVYFGPNTGKAEFNTFAPYYKPYMRITNNSLVYKKVTINVYIWKRWRNIPW